ncbi:hypothetical protein O988_00857 [Pseudogymnoascus sp. VKM F-3808]|nr:hypothetical protein O988_00857 [Pseudogymnoascus sp. VKM F-3808]
MGYLYYEKATPRDMPPFPHFIYSISLLSGSKPRPHRRRWSPATSFPSTITDHPAILYTLLQYSSVALLLRSIRDQKIAEMCHSMITLPHREPESAPQSPEPHLGQILALTPVPSIVLDPKLDIVEVSKGYLSLTSTNREECVGVNIYKFFSDRNPCADCLSIQHAVETVIKSRDVHITGDVRIATGKNWRLRLFPIYGGEELLFIVLEVEEHYSKQANDLAPGSLSYNDETYGIIINNVKDYAIFMLDTKGYITSWNPGARILKQYNSEEIIGQHFSVFYGDEDKAADKPGKELKACMIDGKVEDEGWRYKKDGSRFWASVIISPAYRNGQHIGFSKVTRDITDRKAAETRLISAFEEASKLKSEFLANMSHEIRTPMHGMLAAGMLLMESDLTEEQKELAQIIEESGKVLLQVINDILDYSKLASGAFTVNATTIGVRDIILAVVRASQVTLQPGVALYAKFEDNIPTNVRSDPLRFRQVLQNIVSNAVKFTELGSICIATSISAEDDTSYTLRTEVIDTGIGVAPTAIETIFTPFAPLDSSATKRYRGTGLGLSICKSLVELMGGEIGFRSNEEKGSTCWFTMKLVKIIEKPAVSTPPVQQEPDEKLSDEARSKRILVMEDNSINQRIILKLLKSYGITNIDMAADGKQGVDLIKAEPSAYSLILMDISMPVMGGVEATGVIRDMGLDVPIMAMTAHALKGDRESFLKRGFDDYVSKPVRKASLQALLVKWLDR